MLRLFRILSCSEMVQYLFLASFVHICCGQALTTIDVSSPKQVELYSTLRISCDVNGTLKTGVFWIRPDTFLVSTCAGATNCLPNSGYRIPEATATRNVLEIANTTVQDGGEWTCKDGADGLPSSGRLDVIKKSSACVINSTSSLNNVVQGSQVTLMVYITQYYCSGTALFQLGDANVTLSGTPTGVGDNEGSVTVAVTKSETLDLYMVCGGAPFKQNCKVKFITETTTLPTSPTTRNNTSDISTSTSEGSTVATTTQPDGICKNNLCYLFLLLLLPLITIIVVVVYHKKKKKRTSHANELKHIGPKNKPVCVEVHVNIDESD